MSLSGKRKNQQTTKVITESMVTIPPFKVEFTDKEIEKASNIYKEVLKSGRLILGKFTEEAEEKLKAMESVTSAILVSSGTAALEIIFKSIQIKKVLCPTQTNFATAEAIIRAEGIPIFYDGGLFPSLASIQHAYHKNPDATTLVIVHLGGIITPEMNAIEEWCQQQHIILITDGAHAHGCTLNGKRVASFGMATALSFFPTKVMTTFEGGAILTNHKQLADICKIYRDQGKAPDGLTHIVHGNSWRMPEDHAGLLSIQIENFPRDNDRRLAIIKHYHTALARLDWIELPLLKKNGFNGYKMIIQTSSPHTTSQLKNYLSTHGIICGKGIYDIPLHKQPVFKQHAKASLLTYPIAEKYAQTHICLPCWKGMTDKQINYVINTIQQFSTEMS